MDVPVTGVESMDAQFRIAAELRPCADRLEVRSPYSGEAVGTAPVVPEAWVDESLEHAAAFQPRLTRHERSALLEAVAEGLLAEKESWARLITRESGLCLKDTTHEVERAASVFRLAAAAALHDDGTAFAGDVSPGGARRRIMTLRQPIGLVAAITPFNHPLNQVAHKVAPALAAGNTLVLKPSGLTPLSAYRLQELLVAKGMPPGMLTVVTGPDAAVGARLLKHPAVRAVAFTGSVAVGRLVAAEASFKKLLLELGGNDALIVLDDADIDEAAALAVKGAFQNSGQRCTAVKQVLVHEAVADRLAAAVAGLARRLNWGDPLDPATDVGTVINEAAARTVEDRVSAAVRDGAELLAGHERRGALYAPTVLDRVPRAATLVVEETFGPVLPLLRVRDLDDAISVVNGGRFGLSCGLVTNRLDSVQRAVERLQVGSVNVREVPGWRTETSPFGGIKDSGQGHKEGVLEAMRFMTNLKTYSMPWEP